jgi:hypothetical protein
MSEYHPDAWVIVRVDSKLHGQIDKILSGWYGGYLGADAWRLSSGITKVIPKEDHYEIHNESGSTYYCRMGEQRATGLMSNIYNSWLEKLKKNSNPEDKVTLQIVDISELKIIGE